MIQTIVNAIASQLLKLFTSGFLSGIEGAEIWLLSRLDRLLLSGAQSPISSAWFYPFFQKMELLSLALALPLFLVAVLSAVFLGSGGYLMRLVGVYLPISLIGSGLFLFVLQALAAGVNAMSSWLAASEHLSVGSLVSVASWFNPGGDLSNPVPFFLVALAGVISLIGSLSLYLELVLRQGVIAVLGAFIPFALLLVLLNSSRNVLFRYIEVTVGVLFSKLAIVVLLCLGGELVRNSGSSGGFGQFMTGVAMVILSAFSPFLLLSLLPFAHLDHQRQLSLQARRSLSHAASNGGRLMSGPSAQVVPEIPLASATVVPSYLKQRQ